MEKVKAKQSDDQNYQVPNYFISRSWKRYARVGSIGAVNLTTTNLTNCENGDPIVGLSVVGGIIFISDPQKLSKLRSTVACIGKESISSVQLEMIDGDTCADTAWCSEIESEEECREACHSVTGRGWVII